MRLTTTRRLAAVMNRSFDLGYSAGKAAEQIDHNKEITALGRQIVDLIEQREFARREVASLVASNVGLVDRAMAAEALLRTCKDAETIRILTHQVEVLQAANELMDVPFMDGVEITADEWRQAYQTALAPYLAKKQKLGAAL